ncbi:MAG: hypothetical protein FJ290_25845 [Planctomycetes bacterium]|nr:hypothetical protein [Planctomycetota bacterium]
MSRRIRWAVAAGLVAAVAAAPGAARAGTARQEAEISFIYPAGAQQGATLEITVGGQNLAGTNEVLLTGSGLSASVIRFARPLSAQALDMVENKMRMVSDFHMRQRTATEKGKADHATTLALLAAQASEEVEMAVAKLGVDDPSPSGFAEFRRMISNPKRQPNAQLADWVTVRLTVASNAPPGQRELRLKAAAGITNPLYFHVGQCREYREKEPNDITPDTGALAYRLEGIDLPDAEDLPIILNGQIMPGDVDRFRFRVRKGTRLVAAVSARSLVPYLADAVPGWFQATLALYDPKGRELAYSDDFRFDPDPVIYYEIPEDGEYTFEIHDSIYRGREDFVYRIAVGELPFITSIFPLGGRIGAKTTLELKGWNLPAPTLTLDAQGKQTGTIPVSVTRNQRVSNRVPFALDDLPECLEAEPNNEPPKAQAVKLPIIINGRVDTPGDWDVFAFQGRAGDELVAEVHARRLRSPLDSLLKITDPAGKTLAVNDDHEDKGAGLTTHHADSFLCLKLPADGLYRVHLGDTQRQGGPAHAYRLRISPAQPDYELRVVPSSIQAGPGAIVPIAVHALRKDGFAGEIALSLKDAPKGFELNSGWVPDGQDQVRVTLTFPITPQGTAPKLSIEGCAAIRGAEVRRTATPAEYMMQAFAYYHLVPTKDWFITMGGGGRGAPPVKFAGSGPAKLASGGTGRVLFSLPKAFPPNELRFELDDPPKGITIKEVLAEADAVALVLALDAKEAKPGLKGNLILHAIREVTPEAKEGQPRRAPVRTPLGLLPAVPFEVVPGPPAPAAAPAK